MKKIFTSRLFYAIFFFILLLLLLYKFVFGTKSTDTNLYQSDEIDINIDAEESISEKKLTGMVRKIAKANRQQRKADSNEEEEREIEYPADVETESETEEELRKRVCDSIKATDFTARVHPINTEIYDSEMDREYKEAFLQVLFNQIPIQYEEQGEIYYRECDRCFDDLGDKDYICAIMNPNFRYHYMDFDGDGLPELIVRSENWDVHYGGPHIFKYNPDEKKVYNFGAEYCWSGLRLLGSGKLYYIDSTVATRWYGYRELDASGQWTEEISFTAVSDPKGDIYEVDIIHPGEKFKQKVSVSRDEWNEMTQDFFAAINNAPVGMTFEELFGDVEYPGNGTQ